MDCRSSDPSDHKTDVRRVEYPWHPLYGQDVMVRGQKAGSRGVLRCQVHGDETRDNREIPMWMFDAVVCARMLPTSPPQVCWALVHVLHGIRPTRAGVVNRYCRTILR